MTARIAKTAQAHLDTDNNSQPTTRAPNVAPDAAELFSDVAYVYDGSLEGLLSAVFAAYENHEDPTDIGPEDTLALRLGQTARRIPTDLARARRVERGVVRVCGRGAFGALRGAYLSADPEAPGAIYRFIRHAMAHPTPSPCDRCSHADRCESPCRRAQAHGILAAVTHPAVSPIFQMTRRLANEREKMLQFLRFEHLDAGGDEGLWFARCNPSCLVIPTLMGHFTARFSGAPFIIHDETHQMAGIGGRWNWVLVDLKGGDDLEAALGFPLPTALPEEETMQRAWQRFYDAIAIDARFNPELRTSFMPQRFWPYLTELAGKAKP